MTRRLRSRGGYSLPEVLMYGAILAVLVNLCTALFLSARRVYALGELSITRMDALRGMEDDFRDAVNRSTEIVDGVEGLKLPNVVVALRGETTGDATPFAVWRMGEPGALIFETYESRGGKPAITAQRGYAIDVSKAAAARMEGRANVLQFTVHVDNKGTPNTVPGENTFIARLGGGVRR